MINQISSLNYLRTFMLAAQHLSFKHAASILNITPTAVSNQMKSLEGQLRVSLFHRHTRALTLTSDGELLAATCASSFNQLDRVVTQICQSKTTLSISCCHSLASLWFAPKMADLSQRFNKTALDINASDDVISFAQNKHIDLAIRYGKLQKNSEEIALTTENLAIYQSPQLVASSDKKPLLFATKWSSNNVLNNHNWQALFDLEKYQLVTLEQEYQVHQAVISAQGFGLLSNVHSSASLKLNMLKQVTSQQAMPGYQYCLRINPERKDSLQVRQLVEWISKEFSKL